MHFLKLVCYFTELPDKVDLELALLLIKEYERRLERFMDNKTKSVYRDS